MRTAAALLALAFVAAACADGSSAPTPEPTIPAAIASPSPAAADVSPSPVARSVPAIIPILASSELSPRGTRPYAYRSALASGVSFSSTPETLSS